MQHHLMTNGDIPANHHRHTRIRVDNSTILDIRSLTDMQRFNVTPQHRVKPDTGLILQDDIANEGGVIGNPAVTSQLWLNVSKCVQHRLLLNTFRRHFSRYTNAPLSQSPAIAH